MKTPLLLLALLASLPLLPGCFIARETTNEPLLRERIEGLQVGKTTASEAAEALGAPSEVVELGDRSAWRYEYVVSKTAGFTLIVVTFVNDDRRTDRCWLFFDAKDVLTHVGTTLDAADARYAMPWQDVP
jgi:outer membrane protein assembly factor BamE (lipoprotein component of BamABCDE complex)